MMFSQLFDVFPQVFDLMFTYFEVFSPPVAWFSAARHFSSPRGEKSTSTRGCCVQISPNRWITSRNRLNIRVRMD